MSEIVSRSFTFDVRSTEERDDGLSLEGYAAVFNSPTEIVGERSGPFNEVIAPGAFAKTIENRMPMLQFEHGQHPLIGSLPLGVIQQIREDEHGLFVRARLSDNWLIQPVRDAIRDGAIKGMSFRFAVVQDQWDRKSNTRTVTEAKVYELGPVVFPAYRATTVGVRSELVSLLSDEKVRADLATLLTFGQVSDEPEAARHGTSDESPVEPPAPALDGSKQVRLAAVRRAAPKFKELSR